MYCMPEEGAELTPQDALLSTSEILRLVGPYEPARSVLVCEASTESGCMFALVTHDINPVAALHMHS